MEGKLTPRENALLAYRHKAPQWIPTLFNDVLIIQPCPELERYPGCDKGLDYWGVEWTFEPTVSAPIPTPNRYLFTDIADWKENVHFPDLDAIDWKKQAEKDNHTDFMAVAMGKGVLSLPEGQTNFGTNKLRLCMITNGPFERLHAMMGFENALVALSEDPEECERYFSAAFDWKCRYVRKVGEFYDVDVINCHDDYGTAANMFMRPELWRQIIKPHLKKLVDTCHEYGFVYQHHSCGYIEPIIPDLVEIGVDAIDPLQACNSNLAQLKKEYGNRLTFCGGFDNQHILDYPGATPEMIKAEYRRVIDTLAPGGSYILYPITGTFDFIPFLLEEYFQRDMDFYQRV